MANPEGLNGVDSGLEIRTLQSRITQLEIDKAHFKRRACALEAHLRYLFHFRLPVGNTVEDLMFELAPERHERIQRALYPHQP